MDAFRSKVLLQIPPDDDDVRLKVKARMIEGGALGGGGGLSTPERRGSPGAPLSPASKEMRSKMREWAAADGVGRSPLGAAPLDLSKEDIGLLSPYTLHARRRLGAALDSASETLVDSMVAQTVSSFFSLEPSVGPGAATSEAGTAGRATEQVGGSGNFLLDFLLLQQQPQVPPGRAGGDELRQQQPLNSEQEASPIRIDAVAGRASQPSEGGPMEDLPTTDWQSVALSSPARKKPAHDSPSSSVAATQAIRDELEEDSTVVAGQPSLNVDDTHKPEARGLLDGSLGGGRVEDDDEPLPGKSVEMEPETGAPDGRKDDGQEAAEDADTPVPASFPVSHETQETGVVAEDPNPFSEEMMRTDTGKEGLDAPVGEGAVGTETSGTDVALTAKSLEDFSDAPVEGLEDEEQREPGPSGGDEVPVATGTSVTINPSESGMKSETGRSREQPQQSLLSEKSLPPEQSLLPEAVHETGGHPTTTEGASFAKQLVSREDGDEEHAAVEKADGPHRSEGPGKTDVKQTSVLPHEGDTSSSVKTPSPVPPFSLIPASSPSAALLAGSANPHSTSPPPCVSASLVASAGASPSAKQDTSPGRASAQPSPVSPGGPQVVARPSIVKGTSSPPITPELGRQNGQQPQVLTLSAAAPATAPLNAPAANRAFRPSLPALLSHDSKSGKDISAAAAAVAAGRKQGFNGWNCFFHPQVDD